MTGEAIRIADDDGSGDASLWEALNNQFAGVEDRVIADFARDDTVVDTVVPHADKAGAGPESEPGVNETRNFVPDDVRVFAGVTALRDQLIAPDAEYLYSIYLP